MVALRNPLRCSGLLSSSYSSPSSRCLYRPPVSSLRVVALRRCHDGRSDGPAATLPSAQEILRRLEDLRGRRQAILRQLKTAQPAIDDAERRSDRLVTLASVAVFSVLLAQFVVLFNWVFVVFDWNLVEPMTYFLGYTPVWMGVVMYYATGQEFTYDTCRSLLYGWRRRKLLTAASGRNDEAGKALQSICLAQGGAADGDVVEAIRKAVQEVQSMETEMSKYDVPPQPAASP